MSQDPPKLPSDRNDEIQSVQLGDLLGNDHQLNSSLETISRELQTDSDGTSSYFLLELLAWCKALPRGLTAVAKKSAAFVGEATKRFFNYEAKLILAKAEADKIRITAEADAEQRRATAEKTRAEAKQALNAAEVTLEQGLAIADQTTAETEEARAATKRRDELLKLLKKHGMEFLSEREGDMLNVVVTKNSDQKLIE